jgi:ubiquinone/menaquinone biosynthesis C-methylase UbiE
VWTDRDGQAVEVPEPPADGLWYADIGDFQGADYDRNAFTRGTAQEAAFLWEALRLSAGDLVVDVGCGTGRHVTALAGRGARCVGVDISAGLLRAAVPQAGGFVLADARRLPLRPGSVDAALSVCQGGFGVSRTGDAAVLSELARVTRPGGRVVVTAFSMPFAVRWAGPDDAFDLGRGLVWTPAEVRAGQGERRSYDLWTTCYSPPELAAAIRRAGFRLEGVFGVEPGAYGRAEPTVEHPELLTIASRLNDSSVVQA